MPFVTVAFTHFTIPLRCYACLIATHTCLLIPDLLIHLLLRSRSTGGAAEGDSLLHSRSTVPHLFYVPILFAHSTVVFAHFLVNDVYSWLLLCDFTFTISVIDFVGIPTPLLDPLPYGHCSTFPSPRYATFLPACHYYICYYGVVLIVTVGDFGPLPPIYSVVTFTLYDSFIGDVDLCYLR